MNKVIALIPARSGSKGVPGKNIRLLGGHPLIAWSILAAKKCKLIDRVIVSTDSKEYAEIALNYGAEVPFFRPSEISGDNSTDFDFICHANNWLKNSAIDVNYFVHMRPTTPFRDPAIIDKALTLFESSPHATALRSAHEMSESAYKSFEVSHDGWFKRLNSKTTDLDSANNARQVFPLTFQPNGYVDVLSVKFIQENNMIHGNHVLPFITPFVQEVDSEEDFMFLEYQLVSSKYIFKKIFI